MSRRGHHLALQTPYHTLTPATVQAFEVGGNDISAKCSGESSSNLHAVWGKLVFASSVIGNRDLS